MGLAEPDPNPESRASLQLHQARFEYMYADKEKLPVMKNQGLRAEIKEFTGDLVKEGWIGSDSSTSKKYFRNMNAEILHELASWK